jgi:hypothetical protein
MVQISVVSGQNGLKILAKKSFQSFSYERILPVTKTLETFSLNKKGTPQDAFFVSFNIESST